MIKKKRDEMTMVGKKERLDEVDDGNDDKIGREMNI